VIGLTTGIVASVLRWSEYHCDQFAPTLLKSIREGAFDKHLRDIASALFDRKELLDKGLDPFDESYVAPIRGRYFVDTTTEADHDAEFELGGIRYNRANVLGSFVRIPDDVALVGGVEGWVLNLSPRNGIPHDAYILLHTQPAVPIKTQTRAEHAVYNSWKDRMPVCIPFNTIADRVPQLPQRHLQQEVGDTDDNN